jgi:hypothetical protein
MITKKNKLNKILFTAVVVTILLLAVLFTASCSGDGNIAGEAFKTGRSVKKAPVDAKEVTSQTETNEVRYTWELDQNHINRYGGYVGKVSGTGFENTPVFCPEEGQVVAKVSVSREESANRINIDALGIYCINAPVNGPTPNCAGPGCENEDELIQQAYETYSDSAYWGQSNIISPYLFEKSSYIEGKAFRKLLAISNSPTPEANQDFIMVLKGQTMEIEPTPTQAVAPDPIYEWQYFTLSEDEIPNNGEIYQKTASCPSSDGETAYYMSGMKIYHKPRPGVEGDSIRGIKIYCNKYNRVEQ